ncbi:MAG: hypothetical protein R3195_15220 [Gemmatimonadota bacterium]|nr:hypothetical protein [Gemmatimonadota bacterium]
MISTAPYILQQAQELPPGIPAEPPPLPGGVAAVFRALFHVPQWIQMAGGIVGAIVAIVLAVVLWKRRADIWHWLVTRARVVQATLAGVTLVVLVIGVWVGTASWNYMMHDNDFCTACHVMGSAFQRFTDSEHSTLNCHDCHNQSIFASARQMHLWVLERPEEIGEHAPVPTRTCTECHATGRDSTWQRVLATAGHRVHLESDSTALSEIMCVTCHGQEVHSFIPADQTCAQSGCHREEETRIVLGRMAGQTGFHCISCHEFTRPTSGSPTGQNVEPTFGLVSLTPEHSQCASCHEMSELLGDFDTESEPHGATCGTCHNPHEDVVPEAAVTSCATAGCHDDAAEVTPFHRGLGEAALDDCVSCHVSHTWNVEGTACVDCHADIFESRPPAAGRTAAVDLAGEPAPPDGGVLPAGHGGGEPAGGPAAAETLGPEWYAAARHVSSDATNPHETSADPPPRQQAEFTHDAHADLDCTECHSSERRHGEVMVRTPADCASCHHAADSGAACGSCHAGRELDTTVARAVTLTVAGRPRERTIAFSHGDHAGQGCAECHGSAADAAPTAEAAACTGCHAEHHGAEATCVACHADPPPGGAHDLEVHADLSCTGAGCHTNRTGMGFLDGAGRADGGIAAVCLSCHTEQRDHEPGGDCASCHLVDPASHVR